MSDIKFLIVGLGSIGRRHLGNLLTLGEKNISLLRTHKSTLPDNELGEFPVFKDLDSAFDDPPDAVIISNPTFLHMKVAVKAAQSNCAMLIEKPLSHRFDDLMHFEEIIRGKDLVIQTAHQFRFNPGLGKMKEVLDNGSLGKPISFSCFWGEYLPDWHPWEDYRQSYAANAEMGGGVVLTLSHPIDYLNWLLGDVSDLFAVVGNQSDLELKCVDFADVDIHFKSGVIGNLHLDYFTKPKRHDLNIECEKGTLNWNYLDSNLSIEPKNAGKVSYPAPEDFERNAMFLDEMNHFIACINGQEKPACTYQDGKKALSISEGILRSGRYKARVFFEYEQQRKSYEEKT